VLVVRCDQIGRPVMGNGGAADRSAMRFAPATLDVARRTVGGAPSSRGNPAVDHVLTYATPWVERGPRRGPMFGSGLEAFGRTAEHDSAEFAPARYDVESICAADLRSDHVPSLRWVGHAEPGPAPTDTGGRAC